jgi:hypothetical protein
VIYLDPSVVLAQIFAENRRPPEDLWREPPGGKPTAPLRDLESRALETTRPHPRRQGPRSPRRSGRRGADSTRPRACDRALPEPGADARCRASRHHGLPQGARPAHRAGQLRRASDVRGPGVLQHRARVTGLLRGRSSSANTWSASARSSETVAASRGAGEFAELLMVEPVGAEGDHAGQAVDARVDDPTSGDDGSGGAAMEAPEGDGVVSSDGVRAPGSLLPSSSGPHFRNGGWGAGSQRRLCWGRAFCARRGWHFAPAADGRPPGRSPTLRFRPGTRWAASQRSPGCGRVCERPQVRSGLGGWTQSSDSRHRPWPASPVQRPG